MVSDQLQDVDVRRKQSPRRLDDFIIFRCTTRNSTYPTWRGLQNLYASVY
jgi:hypothetical protein